jgi:tetratricopeptide (TPR) repeat protein
MSGFTARIESELARGNMAAAAAVANEALVAGERTPWLLNMVAWCHEQSGEFAAARALLDEALLIDPGDPLIHISLGAILRQEGRYDEAIATLTSAIPAGHAIGALWLERGLAFDFGGLPDAADADYRRAAAIEPSAPAFAGIASIAARKRQFDAARQAAHIALAHGPENATAQIAMARCDLGQSHFAAAVARLGAVVQYAELHRAERLTAMALLGDANAGLGAHDAALTAYAAAKAGFATWPEAPTEVDGQRVYVERLSEQFARLPTACFTAEADPLDRGHAFLIGFPRSGTTLVENILASIEGVSAIEERPTLREAETAYLTDADGLRRFAQADDHELRRLRTAYRDASIGYGMAPDCPVLVDMDPLKGIKLPLIARLFPKAKVIVMRRDPRDVVWSCFKTPFAPSAAAFEFTSIERAARHYAAVMLFQEQCLTRLPIDHHVLRYESLVTDFDTETRAACAFLGLPWTSDLHDFGKTAVRRGVSTASAGQVERGLYDGRGQWRDYSKYLAPALPILAPWIDRYGYQQDD